MENIKIMHFGDDIYQYYNLTAVKNKENGFWISEKISFKLRNVRSFSFFHLQKNLIMQDAQTWKAKEEN